MTGRMLSIGAALGVTSAHQAETGCESAHQFLRRATRAWHHLVEAGYAGFDIASIGGLAGFLTRQARALLPLEKELDARGAEKLLPDWPERRRSAALIADLACLGSPVEASGAPISLPKSAQMLGALYVLEGSRLGGKLLRRRAFAGGNPQIMSALSYLDHRGPKDGWASFLAILNAVPLQRDNPDLLLAGAEAAFALFHESASGSATVGNSYAGLHSGVVHPACA